MRQGLDMVKIEKKTVERLSITYNTLNESEVRVASDAIAEAQGLGYQTVYVHHLKENPMKYTGVAVWELERDILGA